jgi:replicative DNA helicase
MNHFEAETFLIGGLIARPENFEKVRGKLSPDDFQEEIFGKAYAIFEEIDTTEGMPLDWSTLKSGLTEGLTPDEFQILFGTIENDIGANESLPFWAKQVRRGRIEREIKKAVIDGIDPGRLDSLLNELSSLDRSEILYRPIRQISSARVQGPFFRTGFSDLDSVLRFAPGHLMVIAGRTTLGKTSLGVQMIDSISVERPTGIISLEMSGEEIRDRTENSFNTLPKNLFISDPSSCSSSDFKGICKALKEEQGVEVVLLDYLQLMRERQDYHNRHLEISHIIRRIKEIAKELTIGVIVISQISRGIDARGRGSLPSLGDLKESGDIEYASDTVLFLHQPEKGDEDFSGEDVRLILIAKNRWGRIGKVKVYWNGAKTKFGTLYRRGNSD